MIRMTTWPGKGGNDHAEAEWNGQIYRAKACSATTALARQLVAAGCPEQPWESYDEKRDRYQWGASLHWWATREVTEERRLCIREYME